MWLMAAVCYSQQAESHHPNVRTITAFTRISGATYPQELNETFRFLKAAKLEYTSAGWTVQTVRVTTQPFTE
ncbi:MAG: hypothetical protein NVS9B15_21720 [Acidobacteriaceae bacterium]